MSLVPPSATTVQLATQAAVPYYEVVDASNYRLRGQPMALTETGQSHITPLFNVATNLLYYDPAPVKQGFVPAPGATGSAWFYLTNFTTGGSEENAISIINGFDNSNGQLDPGVDTAVAVFAPSETAAFQFELNVEGLFSTAGSAMLGSEVLCAFIGTARGGFDPKTQSWASLQVQRSEPLGNVIKASWQLYVNKGDTVFVGIGTANSLLSFSLANATFSCYRLDQKF